MITRLRRYLIVVYIAVIMNIYNNNNLRAILNVHTLSSFTYLTAYTASMVFLLWKSLHYITIGDVWQGLAVGTVAALFVALLRAEWDTWKIVEKALRWRS